MRHVHGRIAVASVGLSALIALGGNEALAGKDDNTVVFGQSIAVTDLGPAYGAFLQYPAGYEVSFALYDRLVTFDADLNIQPQLAERWEVSLDQKSVTFHLRPGVVFHDGTALDADAVVFNVLRMMDPERNTTNRPLWDPIAGAEALDELTVRIDTKEPYALLLNTLAHGSGALVSPTSIEVNGDESPTLQPVGAGPFKLASFEPGQEVVLEAFDDYWAGRPQTDKLIFKYIAEAPTRISALKTGSVDVIDQVPVHLLASIEQDPSLQVLTKPSLRPMGLAILTNRPPFDDVRVRQALNHAVPVEAIADKIFFGYAQASDSPLAFNTFGHRSVGSYPHDPEKAKALLAEAGLGDSDGDGMLEHDGEPFQLTLMTPEGTFPSDLQVAEVAANAFRQIGIDATISKVEKGSFWDAVRLPMADLEWDLAQFGFNPSNAAGSYHLDSLFTSNPDDQAKPAVWNIARYRNDEVDRLLAEAKVTVDPAARAELLGQAQTIIFAEAPFVWLQVNEIASAARADLQGVEVWPVIFTIVRNAHY